MFIGYDNTKLCYYKDFYEKYEEHCEEDNYEEVEYLKEVKIESNEHVEYLKI